MRILYWSSMHSTLEHDELTILTELGHTWFSTGHYVDPTNPHTDDVLRGSINAAPQPDLIAEFRKLNPNHKMHCHVNLTKEFVDKFDMVIAGHCCPLPNELFDNWEFVKHKPVIWRTYGQQNGSVEAKTLELRKSNKLTLVRVAKTEANIPNFAGLDFVIKGYIDENIYKGWSGFGGEVLTFNNFFDKRTWHSNTQIYKRVVDALKPHPSSLYGQYNDKVPICKGVLSDKDQVSAYQNCGVYFALSSKPAAITYNFIEALMVGCPVVTFGPKLGTSEPSMPNIYEVPYLVENGLEAFLGDEEDELIFYIKTLLTNETLAKEMSIAGRKKAMKIASKEENKKQWEEAINFARNR